MNKATSLTLLLVLLANTGWGTGNTLQWQGTNSDNKMSTASNWSPAGPPNDDSLTFSCGVGAFSVLDDIAGVLNVRNITINCTTNSYTISASGGNTFSISGAYILNSTGTHTISVPIAITAPWTITSGTGPITLSGTVSGAQPITLTAGSLILSGANTTFTGGLTINATGVTSASSAQALGTGNVTNNGSLIFLSTGNDTFGPTQIVTGSGSVTMAGTGTVTFSGTNTYSGLTTISSGALSITNDNNILNSATVSLGAGTFDIGSTTSISKPILLTAGGTLSANGFIVSFTGTITESTSDAGSINIAAGTGLISLQGDNSYGGGTTVKSGTLQFTQASSLGTGAVTIGGTSTSILQFGADDLTLANAIHLSGTCTIDTASHASPELSGQITGTGPITFLSSASPLVLFSNNGSVTNNYTGGSSVGSGTVQGDSASIQGNFTLTGGTTLIFDQTFNGAYSGKLNSTGTLVKNGSGTVTVSGISATTFTGATTINDGTLFVTGSLRGSTITVNPNGTLAGGGTSTTISNTSTGTVGTVNTSGTLGPNGVAILNISGDLLMSGSPETIINIKPAGVSDLINVSGTATISGPVLVEPFSGFYGFGGTYTILQSGTLSGAFTSATPNPPDANFSFTVSNVGDNVILTLTVIEPFFDFPASNRNTRAVANNLNALGASGALQSNAALVAMIDSLEGSSNAVVNNALDQLHPAPFSALTEWQAEFGGQALSLFHRRPGPTCCSKTGRVWLAPIGNWLDEGEKGIQVGFFSRTLGFAAGIDWELFDRFVLGFGGYANHSDLHWKEDRGNLEFNSYAGAAYFDYTHRCFYLGGSLIGGVDHINSLRKISFTTTHQIATATHNAFDLMAQISGGLVFGPSSCFLFPYFNVDYFYLRQSSFSENGAYGLDLSVQAFGDQTLRTELGMGLQVQDTNYRETMCISPKMLLGWALEAPLSRPLITSAFQGETIDFNVYGWDHTWELFFLTLGMNMSYKCFTLGGDYTCEFSSDGKYLAQKANIGLKFNW